LIAVGSAGWNISVWTRRILVHLGHRFPMNLVEVQEMERSFRHTCRRLATSSIVASFALTGSLIGMAAVTPASTHTAPAQITPFDGFPALPAPTPGVPMPNPDPKQIPIPVPVPGGGA
jgi:hypothetical protein